MNEESYFTDTTMNGNTAHLIFEDMRAGKKTLLKCFVDYPEYYQKYDTLLSILTKIDTLLSTPVKKLKKTRKKLLKLWKILEDFSQNIFIET